jgi:hypothetical protein
MRSIFLLFRNILIHSHKNIFFLTLVPQKILVITIITKTLKLAFNHFILSQFMDIEGSGRKGGKGGFRERNKGVFMVWEDTTYCASLARFVASNQVWG